MFVDVYTFAYVCMYACMFDFSYPLILHYKLGMDV